MAVLCDFSYHGGAVPMTYCSGSHDCSGFHDCSL